MLPKALVALAFAIAAGACSTPALDVDAGVADAGDAAAEDVAAEDVAAGDVAAGDVAAGDTSVGGVPCVITLSGAVNKTIACLVEAFHEPSTGLSTVGVASPTRVEGAPEAVFVLLVWDPLMTKTYGWADSVNQRVTVSQPGPFIPTFASSMADRFGTSSMTLTSIAPATSDSPSQTAYEVHGSATATLVSLMTGGGSVTFNVTF